MEISVRFFLLAISTTFILIPMMPAAAQKLPTGPAAEEVRGAIRGKAPHTDHCNEITPVVLDRYADEIGTALSWATKDAVKNGASGQYAVAATNSRDLFKRAQDKAKEGAQSLRKANPSVTTYAEAGVIKETVRSIIETVPQASHWATISAIYHKSVDAERAFDQSVVVLNQGNSLFAASSRCYMAPYLKN